ncbi:CaiB/BaiF CoA-transferase family protein [Nocardia nova]|nr:CoA transferase [Nocardia nova]
MRIIDMLGPHVAMSTRYLADLGAEVITVTSPADTAERTPDSAGPDLRAAIEDANKLSVVLDLDTPGGRDVLLRLLSTADVWVIAARQEELVALDLPNIRARLPRLVVVSVTDFGLTGPYRHYRGDETTRAAMAGILCRSGIAGRPPLLPPANILDNAIAAQISWAILIAHWHRLHTGSGDHLDISLLDTATQVFDPAFGAGPTAGYGRPWSEYPHGRPDAGSYYPVFDCADGQVRITVLSPQQWRSLWRWLGEPEEFADPRYERTVERQAAHSRLAPLIAKLFAGRSAMELAAEGQRRGVPMAPVLALGDVVRANHFHERDICIDLEVAPGVDVPVPAGYVEINGIRAGIRHPARRPGADNEAILGNLPERVAAAIVRPGARRARGRPLAGLRVIDMGIIIAGAEAGRMFADYGAEVIKVENRAHPDGSRAPFTGEVLPAFAWGNRNKQSIDIDLRTTAGAELLAELLDSADVLLSNFKPGTLDKLGFGRERLMQINPNLVTVQSNAVGDVGPWSSWMGYGPLVRAVCGLSSLWQYPDTVGAAADGLTVYPDHVAGRIVATAALAALIGRRRDQRVTHVTCAQSDIILTALATDIAAEARAPGSVRPHGNAVGTDVPSGVYPCAGDDEWCVISIHDSADYHRLRSVLPLPDLPDAERRRVERAELDAAVSAWTRQRTCDEVTQTLQAAGICAGPMRRIPSFATDPAFRQHRIFTTLYQPTVREPIVAERRQFSSEYIADAGRLPAPAQGQHTRHICTDLLGLTDDDVDRLIHEGVLDEPDPWAPVHYDTDYSRRT